MNDDLEGLRAALKSTPTPDPAAKAAALRLAMENFDRHQETATQTRPMSDRPERVGLLTGVRKMISQLSPRAALAATASVAALGIGMMIYPALQRDLTPPRSVPQEITGLATPDSISQTSGAENDILDRKDGNALQTTQN
ncbi:MAG: hypothetical protein WBO29_11700, partial [Albidovulum sp.]